jgi:hypothetical protein
VSGTKDSPIIISDGGSILIESVKKDADFSKWDFRPWSWATRDSALIWRSFRKTNRISFVEVFVPEQTNPQRVVDVRKWKRLVVQCVFSDGNQILVNNDGLLGRGMAIQSTVPCGKFKAEAENTRLRFEGAGGPKLTEAVLHRLDEDGKIVASSSLGNRSGLRVGIQFLTFPLFRKAGGKAKAKLPVKARASAKPRKAMAAKAGR